MTNKSNNLSMILNAAHDVGINFQILGDDIGVARNTISSWSHGKHSPNDPCKVINAVNKKSKYLQKLTIKDSSDLDDVRREIGIKEAKLAEILGVSRQYLNWQKKEGFDSARLKEVQSILRGLGEQLGKIVKKYS